MPEAALNLAGFNEDDAENIYENRRRFLNLFAGDWTLAGCWQMHSADVRIVHNQMEAQAKPGVLGDDVYCDALVSNTPGILLGVKTADCVPVLLGDPETDVEPRRLRMAGDRRREHLDGLFERVQLHQVVGPIEQVFLGWIHVRGALILVGRGDEVARALFDIAEQVVELAGLP